MNLETIRDYVKSEILADPSLEIGPDDDLLLTGTLDSLGVARLVQHIESETGMTVPPEDVTLENFRSLTQITAYVRTRRE